jgi:tetraacyldisaccharide 4'-kinase
MLVHLLQEHGVQVAVLSRGYKRKTRGFLYVKDSSLARDTGDESLQIKRRYPDAIVAVSENRVKGIKQIKKDDPNVRVVILDDAYQHRKVRAGMSILLTTYDKLMTKDMMMPLGTLRDKPSRRSHADMVIITKCPRILRPIDFNVLEKDVKLYPYQCLYFTSYVYKAPIDIKTKKSNADFPKSQKVIAVAGIAKPEPFFEHVEKNHNLVRSIAYTDHHNFGASDIARLERALREHPESIVMTTEKDAVRLADCKLSKELQSKLYYVPISVQFLNNGKPEFSKKTISYVRENKRISIFC